MKLSKLTCKGFRSLCDCEVDFLPLTVLIGENDAGKSSVLDILDIVLNGGQPDTDDYYVDSRGRSLSKIEVILEFEVDASEVEAAEFCVDGRLRIKKVYSHNAVGVETFYWGEQPVDKRFRFQNFYNLSAQEQKDLIQEAEPTIGPGDISNKEKRVEWLKKYLSSCEKEALWIQVSGRWGNFLPRFERYSSMDYKEPANIIVKTLRQVYENFIYESSEKNGNEERDEFSSRRLIPALREVEESAKQQIQAIVADLESFIKRYDPRVKRIGYEPVFDFESSLRSGEFTIDVGRGLHRLSKTGDGTKRRMFMAVLDWDREVAIQQVKEQKGYSRTIIRGYDEPDTNLHYEAQRLMFQAISDITTYNERMQAILCTHSLTMIDRAPAQAIRLLGLDGEGCSYVSKIIVQDDPEIERFLVNLARELGITNSVIFYERCFVLVEGETEHNALPLLYKKRYGRSLFEDGIRLINLKGNGAAKEFLRLLSRNRQSLTLIVVDSDTRSQGNSTGRLTERVLKESGFDDKFIAEHLIYVGSQEFEDAFSNEVIALSLQQHWPKQSGEWTPQEVEEWRIERKFSDNIKAAVWEQSGEETPKWSKPLFGVKLAETCSEDDIPEIVIEVFEKARRIAGIT